MTVYCPRCWTENSIIGGICQRCGASLKGGPEEDFVAKLISALRHPDPLTRRRAAWILGELRERRALEALISALESSDDPDLLEAGGEALGKIGDARAIGVLSRLAQKSYLTVRIRAVEALGRVGGAEAGEALKSALQDANTAVRAAAAGALQDLGRGSEDGD